MYIYLYCEGIGGEIDHLNLIFVCMNRATQTWEGRLGNVLTFCLIVAALCLELNSATGHDTSSQHVTVKLLLGGKT